MDDILQFITIFIIFIFVVLVTYFTIKWISNFQKSNAYGKNIEMLESARISNNKYIQIVKIGKDYLALAICKDTVTVINKMSEEELKLTKELPSETGDSFQKIFERFRNNKKNK